MMDRQPIYSLYDLFNWFPPQALAFVRVIKTEQNLIEHEPFSWSGWATQTATVQILSTVWSVEELPQVMSITQSMIEHFCLGTTNLIREGGVYMLPLSLWESKWYVSGDLDVLFEVDDKGLVWSHSEYEGFNRFDGKGWSELAQVITEMTTDEDFNIAMSVFSGFAVSDWWILAEVTVLSSDTATSEGGASITEALWTSTEFSTTHTNSKTNPPE